MNAADRLKSAPRRGNPPGQQREPWWVVAVAWLGFAGVLALVALVFGAELAPAELRAWLHSFLFG